MEPALFNPQQQAPLIALPHNGRCVNAISGQQSMDDRITVGSGRFGQPSFFNNKSVNLLQQPLIDTPDGSPMFPGQQPTCGLSSVGLGYSEQQQPFASHHPGSIFHHPVGPSASQEGPSINDLLLHCSPIIHQLIQRQQYNQQTLLTTAASSTRSAMAAAPSSSQPTEQQFEVRISMRPKQAPSDARQDSPFNIINCLDHGQVELHEGGRKSRTIQKGRKLSNNVTLQRGKCDVEFGRTKSQLQLTAVSDTAIVIGKQFGSPASPSAVSASAATDKTLQLTDEFSRDVIIGSPRYRKPAVVFEKPVKGLGSDRMNNFDQRFRIMLLDPFSCHIADPPASAVHGNISVESIRQKQCNDRPASCAIDAVDIKPDQRLIIIIPNYCSMCVSVHSNEHQHTPSPVHDVYIEPDYTKSHQDVYQPPQTVAGSN